MKSLKILTSLLIAVALLAALKYSLMGLSSLFESWFGLYAVAAAIVIFTVVGALAGILTIALLKASSRAELEADLAQARDDYRKLLCDHDGNIKLHSAEKERLNFQVNTLQNEVLDLKGTIKLRNKTLTEKDKELEQKGDTIRSLNREIDRQKDRYAAKDQEYDALMVRFNSEVKDNARMTDKNIMLMKLIGLVKEKYQLTDDHFPELKDYDLVA